MRIAQIVKLLASSSDDQRAVLKNAPQDANAASFSKDNDVYRMVLLCLDSWMPSEGMDGSEGTDNWLARTQLSKDFLDQTEHPFWTAIQYLNTALRMIQSIDRPFLYTLHGLRSAHEWKLVRYLAGNACATMGWSKKPDISDFSELWEKLGDGVVGQV